MDDQDLAQFVCVITFVPLPPPLHPRRSTIPGLILTLEIFQSFAFIALGAICWLQNNFSTRLTILFLRLQSGRRHKLKSLYLIKKIVS
jgi:hypothetical protein